MREAPFLLLGALKEEGMDRTILPVKEFQQIR